MAMVIPAKICDELDDVQIVQRALAEIDYFSCLYERYEPRLLQYIKRITSLSDPEAEDVLQEAFINIWRNLNAYDSRLKFSSWIYRIVHNQAISAVRKNASFGKDRRTEWNDALLAAIADDTLPEPATEADEVLSRLGECLHTLPAAYREVLLLRYMEQMSYEEISDVLKMPEGTVATRINRAKKALAQKWMSNIDHQNKKS